MVKYYARTSKDFPKTGMNTLTSQLKLSLNVFSQKLSVSIQLKVECKKLSLS